MYSNLYRNLCTTIFVCLFKLTLEGRYTVYVFYVSVYIKRAQIENMLILSHRIRMLVIFVEEPEAIIKYLNVIHVKL